MRKQTAFSLLLTLLAAALALPACGGPPETARTPAENGASSNDTGENAAAPLRGDLAKATVYDASGNARSCEPPNPDCSPYADERNRDLRDKCKLAGFHVRQCGCSIVCSGNIAEKSAAKKFYDASGAPQACEPQDAACTPPAASAAFQDACTDKGHRLQICGCAWLCTGNPTP